MNDNDSTEALVARCRTLEQALALVTAHVAPSRSGRPPVLTLQVMRSLEAAAERADFPASTRDALRRAAAALGGEGRAARGRTPRSGI
ncbi:hypothetical protein [Methylobacterium oxalidis]|uniref:Uncharacterized protein n=1 Tax=Methylobacterium oxalidis TaxID=944322 RepID=A0A512J263_9HYPH|nr:hypothetical protein [Methylobacterium oxalidis]GEP04052.1 hypothetical protein MOX02_20900 [Methylobacterium oxalidis]GJE33206.1 hypothetical protein LDDCCGHA_3405 [Methylobacterium oxalidis]GLS65119.1 hypothetical protein GCM10007888_35000 [Methylobacterium oxalidis]